MSFKVNVTVNTILCIVVSMLLIMFSCTERKKTTDKQVKKTTPDEVKVVKQSNKTKTKVFNNIILCPFDKKLEADKAFKQLKKELSEDKEYKLLDLNVENGKGFYAKTSKIEDAYHIILSSNYLVIFKGYNNKKQLQLQKEVLNNIASKTIAKAKSTNIKTDVVKLLPVPDELTEYKIVEKNKVYAPDTLMDLVNGNDTTYMSYGFRRGATMTVTSKDSKDDDASLIKIELFDMGTPLNAFGIYSVERPAGMEIKPFGFGGTSDKFSIAYWKDRFYVKVITTKQVENKLIVKLAKLIDNKITVNYTPKDVLTWMVLFPQKDRVKNSEQYKFNILGYEFLPRGLIVSYEN